MCCLCRAISDCIHGWKKSSLPAAVPPVLVDLNVRWNLDGCLQIEWAYRRRAEVRFCTKFHSTLSHRQEQQRVLNLE